MECSHSVFWCDTYDIYTLAFNMSNYRILSILIISQFVFGALGAADVNEYSAIVAAYFSFKQIFILTHFTCFTRGTNDHSAVTCVSFCRVFCITDEQMRLSMRLSDQNFQSRFVTNFSDASRFLDTNNSTIIQGFVIDSACKDYQKIFDQKPHEVIFKNNNFWLLLDEQVDGAANQMVTDMEISVKNFLTNFVSYEFSLWLWIYSAGHTVYRDSETGNVPIDWGCICQAYSELWIDMVVNWYVPHRTNVRLSIRWGGRDAIGQENRSGQWHTNFISSELRCPTNWSTTAWLERHSHSMWICGDYEHSSFFDIIIIMRSFESADYVSGTIYHIGRSTKWPYRYLHEIDGAYWPDSARGPKYEVKTILCF